MTSADSLAISTAVSTDMPTSAALKSGAVVDPVAQKADDVTAALARRDDPRLLGRSELGKHRIAFDQSRQIRVARSVDLGAEDDAIDVKADFAADLACDDIIVAGKDFDPHAGPAECRDGWPGAFLRRIQKCDVAQKRQIAFVGYGVRLAAGIELLVGDRDDPEAVGIERAAQPLASSRWLWSRAPISPSISKWRQTAKTSSIAPLQIRICLTSSRPNTTVRRRRTKSNGISSTL